MKICWSAFNIILMAACALLLFCGCSTPETKHKKKIYSTIRVFLETRSGPMGKADEVTIGRANPVKLSIEKVPFIDERFVKEALVVDVVGGFTLQLHLEKEGTMLLEQYTSSNPGKHMAIFSQFHKAGTEDQNDNRWLAGPRITGRITDGVLTFTPDATREETDLIALGLNHMSEKLKTGQPPSW